MTPFRPSPSILRGGIEEVHAHSLNDREDSAALIRLYPSPRGHVLVDTPFRWQRGNKLAAASGRLSPFCEYALTCEGQASLARLTHLGPLRHTVLIIHAARIAFQYRKEQPPHQCMPQRFELRNRWGLCQIFLQCSHANVLPEL